VCSLSLSFNNDGPLGSVFRYVCDQATYVARYDDLVDGWDRPVAVCDAGSPSDGVELQDREFLSAIAEGRQPNGAVADVLPAYRVLDALQRDLAAQAVSGSG
jgi:2-hydroxy-4-carboxymuconate semialdehyde hemiacetal dehydrogenase